MMSDHMTAILQMPDSMGVKRFSFAATIILFHMYWSCFASTRFVESPSSMIIEVENGIERDAVFRCRHQRIDAFINWRINGSSSRLYPDVVDGSVRDSNGTLVDTLTIPAIPEKNGTEVVCVATFLDGSPLEVTPPATLIVIETLSLSTSLPTPRPGGFELVPSPLTVAVEQGAATFWCRHSSCDAINWLVNGTSLNRVSTLSSVSAFVLPQNSVTTFILSIGTLLEYNQTTVQCVGTFFDGSPPEVSAPVSLLVQDTPEKVNNASCQRDYTLNTLITLWSPLLTLDLTDIDPDIIYTVELFKITCGQNTPINHTVVAGNNATEENLDLMQIYKAVIAARNNVREARNGPSVTVEETFMSLNGLTLLNLARNSQVNMISLDPVPSFYVLILESLDGHGNNLVINITVQRNSELVSIVMGDTLPTKSLWNASILAYGCESDATVTELSTHDIQNITVSSLLPGQIRVTSDCVDGSTATGVLLIIYSLINDSNVQYIAKQREQNKTTSGLTGTEYGVSIFALEDGLPFPRVVTSPMSVNVIAVTDSDQGRAQQPQPVEYKLYSTLIGVCITCIFLDSSTTDCVAVVHQRISQLSSRGLMNIESSHRFTRSGNNIAYGCIEGVNLEQYQVGVVGGIKVIPTIIHSSSPRSSYCLGCIIGIITAAIFGMVVLVGIVLSVLIFCIKRCSSNQRLSDGKLPAESEVNVDMQRCGAYEVVKLSRQKVTMKDNPAYVDVNLYTLA